MDTQIKVTDAMERAYIDAAALHNRADFVRVGLQAALDASGLRMIGEATEEEAKRAYKAFSRSNGNPFDCIAAALRDFAARRVERANRDQVEMIEKNVAHVQRQLQALGLFAEERGLIAPEPPAEPAKDAAPAPTGTPDDLALARALLSLTQHQWGAISEATARHCGASSWTGGGSHYWGARVFVRDELGVDDTYETRVRRKEAGHPREDTAFIATAIAEAVAASSSRGGVFGDGGVNAENLAELAKKFVPTGTRVTDVATLRVGDRVIFLAGGRDELFTGTVEEALGTQAMVMCDGKNPAGLGHRWFVRHVDSAAAAGWRDLRLLPRADAQEDAREDAQGADWKTRAEEAEREVLALRQRSFSDHSSLVIASGLTHMGRTGVISTRDCLDEFCRVRGELAGYATRAEAAEKRVGELEASRDQWKAQVESFVSQGYEVACERDALKAQLAERDGEIGRLYTLEELSVIRRDERAAGYKRGQFDAIAGQWMRCAAKSARKAGLRVDIVTNEPASAEPASPSPAYATAEEVDALREAVSWLAGAVSALRCGEGHVSVHNLLEVSKKLAESDAKARKGGA